MNVKVQVELCASPTEVDKEEMHGAARHLTNDKERQRTCYTPKQGQYLAFTYYYTRLNGYPPTEADMQRYFRTTPPSVHSMVMQLAKKGFIEKKPSAPRSIRLLLSREELPDLE